MKITKYNQIKPGLILWEVNCVCGYEAHEAKLLDKQICISFPYLVQDIGVKFDYIGKVDDFEYQNGHFLSTFNISTEHPEKEIYPDVMNLHRLFTTKESAQEYIIECKTGKFTDKSDQDFYDYSCTPEYIRKRLEFLSEFN